MKYRKKKIFLDTKGLKYCIIKLYPDKKSMQDAYKLQCPNDKNHSNVRGVHNAYYKYKIDGNKAVFQSETGTIFLNVNDCGAGVVSHELLHATLWAYKHAPRKKQFPIIIKNMQEEETIAHNHTYAVTQFYQWYWKVVEKNEK